MGLNTPKTARSAKLGLEPPETTKKKQAELIWLGQQKVSAYARNHRP